VENCLEGFDQNAAGNNHERYLSLLFLFLLCFFDPASSSKIDHTCKICRGSSADDFSYIVFW
jgi:hypothetical protein